MKPDKFLPVIIFFIILTGVLCFIGREPLYFFFYDIFHHKVSSKYRYYKKRCAANEMTYNAFLCIDAALHEMSVNKKLRLYIKKRAIRNDLFSHQLFFFSDSALLQTGLINTGKSKLYNNPLIMAVNGYKLYQHYSTGNNINQQLSAVSKAEAIFEMASSADKKYFYGYRFLLETRNYDFPQFCRYIEEGIALYGVALIAKDIVNANRSVLYSLEKNCNIFGLTGYSQNNIIDKIIEIKNDDYMSFLKGVKSLNEKKYNDAQEIFYSLKNYGSKTVKANAAYCLGVTLLKSGTVDHKKASSYILESELGGQYTKYSKNIEMQPSNLPGSEICTTHDSR